MRILWLTSDMSIYNNQNPDELYHGSGWVESLQLELQKKSDIELAIVFPSSEEMEVVKAGNTTYYPLFKKPQSAVRKLSCYYGGYKKIDENIYVQEINQVIAEFKPEIIQLFGLECPLANILEKTDIPVIVHMQGLLGACNNAFYPVEMDKNKIARYGSFKREILLRNGFNYAKKWIAVRSEYEKDLFKNVVYADGRTHWDQLILSIYSPHSKYYKVNEVLRSVFYDSLKWKYSKRDQLIIVSTLSETMYKGLDLVLKTAKILKEVLGINFEWKIVGVKKNSSFVDIFERTYHIKSKDVDIKYEGVQNAEQICNTLLASNLYVHTSYIDNSPNSVCEAQLLGMPIIATNVGGVSSLIEDGMTGELVPANSPEELAHKIIKISDNEKYAKTLGENASDAATKRHDRDSIVQTLMTAYNDVIDDFGK